MKTRSQTRKEKHDHQKPKVPQLNEDVMGIILKHVMRKEKKYMMETYWIIQNHFNYDITIRITESLNGFKEL